jgi:predicted MarR family transcription regulator
MLLMAIDASQKAERDQDICARTRVEDGEIVTFAIHKLR